MRIDAAIWEDVPRTPATWRVLTVFLRNEAITQADLRDLTGLSHPVIVQQVRQLRKAGLLTFGMPISGQPGRPRTPMTFNWNFRRLLAVEVHADGLTMQATNLAGVPMGEPTHASLPSWTAEGIRKGLSAAISSLFKQSGPVWAGIGIVFPGTVSADGQNVLECLNVPSGCPLPLGTELSAEFNVPVTLDTHANALAYAVRAEQPDHNNIIAISLRHANAIAAGLVIDGNLVRGAGNRAGNIGHIVVHSNGASCACGINGCLESFFAQAQQDAAQRPAAIAALASVTASLVIALNPGQLVLQGDDAWSAGDTALLEEELQKRCSPAMLDGFTLESRPSRSAEALSGVAMQLADQVLNLAHGQLIEWVDGSAA
ncbi:MAG: ROK family transcriptional regulator [Armatimonadota bacterium]